jgi:hypothetical protein
MLHGPSQAALPDEKWGLFNHTRPSFSSSTFRVSVIGMTDAVGDPNHLSGTG